MELGEFHPTAKSSAATPVDLSDPAEQERLSSAAAHAFFNIMERWGVSTTDARRLLGGMPSSSYFALKKDNGTTLGEDMLYRISFLIGIFKALHIIHSEELADRWMKLPNKNRIFGGKTPLEFLMRGGLPAFAMVRRLLDARSLGQ